MFLVKKTLKGAFRVFDSQNSEQDQLLVNTKNKEELKSSKGANGLKLKLPGVFGWKEKLLLLVAVVGIS